jgi:hypothetical protein
MRPTFRPASNQYAPLQHIGLVLGMAVTAMSVSALATPAYAWICSKPDKPFCLSMLGSADKATFSMCRAEVERYRQDVIEFVQCATREQNDAADELKQVIANFNTCATSKYC